MNEDIPASIQSASNAAINTIHPEASSATEPVISQGADEQLVEHMPITAFRAWSERYLAALGNTEIHDTLVPEDLLEEGRTLAQVRAPKMLSLMRQNPKSALEHSLKLHEWAALPKSIQTLVEEPFSEIGDFDHVPNCSAPKSRIHDWQAHYATIRGEMLPAHVYGWRNNSNSKHKLPLRGILLAGEVALWEDSAQILDPADLKVARGLFSHHETFETNTVALLGDRLMATPSPEAVARLNHIIAEAAKIPNPDSIAEIIAEAATAETWGTKIQTQALETQLMAAAAATNPWTETPKDVLVIRVYYSDQTPDDVSSTLAVAQSNFAESSEHISNYSYGKTSINPTFTSELAMPQTKAYYEDNGSHTIATDARNVAESAGFVLSDYDIYVYALPATGGNHAGWAGLGSVNGSNHWLNGNVTPYVIIHEFGHNFGLIHANFWAGYTGTHWSSRNSDQEHQEYGDDFDTMGSWNPTPAQGHFAPNSKYHLNWIEATEVEEVNTTGLYRIYRFDHGNARQAGGRKLALKMQNADGETIWVGFRRAFPDNTDLSTGAYVTWANRDNTHRFIDTSPLSVSNVHMNADKADGAVAVGESWADPTGRIRIATKAWGGTAPDEWLDVQINIAEFDSGVQFFIDATESTAGLTGNYVDANLRAVNDDDWTDGSQTIAGTRIDDPVDFPNSNWGTRAPLGLTGGSDSNWNNFSVQWEGFVRVTSPTRLATVSDDSSRMWIDYNNNDTFEADELVDNHWGRGQGATQGDVSKLLVAGLYRIRVQYEEGGSANSFKFAIIPQVGFEVFTDPTGTTPGLIGSYVDSSLRNYSAKDDWRVSQTIAGTRVDSYPLFIKNGWGAREPLGLTSGSDDNWEDFSVQWDGYLKINAGSYRFATVSDDGSRMWIDVAGDGFDHTLPDFVDTKWGSGHGSIIGNVSNAIDDSIPLRPIRIQYEEGGGGNNMRLWGVASTATDDHGDAIGAATILSSIDFPHSSIERKSDRDLFRFQIPSSGLLRIESVGSDLDLKGSLRNNSGFPLVSDDNGGSGNNFAIETELTADSSYYLEVESLGSATGEYEIIAEYYPFHYEAELATLSGPSIQAQHTGYSGTGYVDYTNATGDFIEWSVTAPEAGDYDLVVRYANGSLIDLPLELAVNSTVLGNVSFPRSGSWAQWVNGAPQRVALNAGQNLIRLTTIGWNTVSIDFLRIQSSPTSATQADFIIEDYDNNGVASAVSSIGADSIEWLEDATGNHVLKIVDDGVGWGTANINRFDTELDIRSYRALEFWFYSDASDHKRTIQVQLSFTNSTDSDIENFWNLKEPIPIAEGYSKWKKVRIDLDHSNFERASTYRESNIFDLMRLNQIAVLILTEDGVSEKSSPIYVDNITLSSYPTAPEPTPVSLTLENYDGGGVDGQRGDQIFGVGLAQPVLDGTGTNKMLKMVDGTLDTEDFGLVDITELTSEVDISGYGKLEFWFYSEAPDNKRTLQVQLGFANSNDSDVENLWSWQEPVVLADGYSKWKNVSIDLTYSEFARASGYTQGNDFNLNRLNQFRVLILSQDGASAESKPVYMDNIALSGSAPVRDTFADWIGTYPEVGGQTEFHQDPDHDGYANAFENFFDTDPSEASLGLTPVVMVDSNTFTFTHPQAETPASDLVFAYQWSKNLQDFYADGATDTQGTTVSFTMQTDTPVLGITTVTANLLGTNTNKLFFRLVTSEKTEDDTL